MTTVNNQNPFDKLPEEINMEMLGYLGPVDLRAMSQVDKRSRRLTGDWTFARTEAIKYDILYTDPTKVRPIIERLVSIIPRQSSNTTDLAKVHLSCLLYAHEFSTILQCQRRDEMDKKLNAWLEENLSPKKLIVDKD